ncbi:hypothetical protein KQH40_01125 [bacterium]|nr:hypothetical protein [bacterium]
MWKLDKPKEISKDIFLSCISIIKNNELKRRLESVVDIMDLAEKEYDRNGINRSLYALAEHGNVGCVTKEEMVDVYKIRMARKNTPGRSIYEKIKTSSPYGICPLCGQRTVSTVDHYLPKTRFPSFVVTPYNLIPACSECNKLTSNEIAKNAEEQTLHPYYDDLTSVQWLFANVIEGKPITIVFFVRGENVLDKVMIERIRKHFDLFELGALYASHAGQELANIYFHLQHLIESAGAEAVKKHVAETYESFRAYQVNSWKTAMYQALANSDWFCNGGFTEIV